ncbi:MAG: protein kinase domain-containing protein [Gemmatimonadaceae bacterium]
MGVIDRDRWRDLAPLLDRALELSPSERAAWLDELRARSPQLAAQLTALLAREDAADRAGFLDDSLGAALGEEVRAATLAEADLAAYLQVALGDVYTIERELGGGGMSRVFLAHEHALGRTVVVKVLLPVLVAGIRAERFAREVRMVAALQHPNIVPLFKAGEAAGLPYYVMPYVRGESLRARLTREGPLSLADALAVLHDVARALSFAHEQGVVHRDVKPENVLLAGDPSTGSGHAAAVVTDFGIAKAVVAAAGNHGEGPSARDESARDLRTLSAVGTTIGTPAYMAPEQAAGDRQVDHRADIYAFGIMAYELLAGVYPFADRETPQELLAAHLGETPAPLARRAPELSATLTTLVMRCLEKDRTRRPQSAREILDALATVATPPPGRGAAAWRRRGRGRRALLAGAGVIVLALAAYATAWRIDRRSPATAVRARAPTLAVLPFDDVSGDTTNAYLGDGIADEIATALSKVGGLRVASRTSAAAFRSSHNVDVRELGRRLGVSTVLEGRVRRAGDRMRLTVQLTSVDDGLTLWSDVYERQVKDVFAMQGEIARSVVGALRATMPGTVGPQLGRALLSAGTTNPDAYDLYLRGTYLMERRGSGVPKAVEYFERAIAEDSTFARAYAALGYALVIWPNYGGPSAPAVEHRAMDAARRALALDSTLGEAYVALAQAHQYALRWSEAGDAFRHAVAADPGFAPAEYLYGLHLLRTGRTADAEEYYRRGRMADPLSGTASVGLAYCLSLLGRYDESLAESRRAYELDSSLFIVHALLALAVLNDGRAGEARALARAALPIPYNGMAAYVLGATGDRAGAGAIVRQLERHPRGEWHVARTLGYAYLGLGDTARALSALEDAARAGEAPVMPLSDPMFDAVRRSPRFAAVVRQLRLDERIFTSATGGRLR